MINELIEKEIEKFRKEGEKVSFDWSNAGGDWNLEALFEESLQTIVKEVVMRFETKAWSTEGKSQEFNFGKNFRIQQVNDLANSIINEVSK